MKSIKRFLLNLIYPPRCVFCQARVSPKSGLNVCTGCANNLPYTRAYTRCKRCGKPIAAAQPSLCRHCRLIRHYLVRVTSAFVYTDAAKRGVIAFKKEYNAENAKTLSVYIADMVRYDFKNVEFDYIVSVPPRKTGSSAELFDQAAALAKAVAGRLSIPYLSGAMYQKERIRKQSSLNYNERERNVKDNFVVRNPGKIVNKTILLIDDVCTSGATLRECAKTLKESGAYKIYAATLTTVPSI